MHFASEGPERLEAAPPLPDVLLPSLRALERQYRDLALVEVELGPWCDVGYASVSEFVAPADAAAYLVDGVTTIEARGARVYDVAEPVGGKGFSQVGEAAADEGSTVSHGVVFVDGERFFLVFVSGRDSSVDPTLAAEAARSVAGA